MKISVTVKAGAKKEEVMLQQDGSFRISVKAPAQEGKANDAVRELLADYLGISKSAVRMVTGFRFPKKIFEISL